MTKPACYLYKIGIIFLFLFFSACNETAPDTPQPPNVDNRKSPIAISSVSYQGAYIKVVYGQPYRRGRTIFGELEPYGEVWRTGANEATEITITDTVLMGSEAVYPGTYSLFTIPKEDSWTIILNRDLGLWGAFDYNENRDYKRIDFPVQKLEEPIEAFTIQFSQPKNNTTTLSFKWDVVQVDVPIRFY